MADGNEMTGEHVLEVIKGRVDEFVDGLEGWMMVLPLINLQGLRHPAAPEDEE